MKRILKGFLFFLAFLLILSIAVIRPVDRSPYQERYFYEVMDGRLDSLERKLKRPDFGSLNMGFAKVSITPADTLPLAGYSARKPKEFTRVLDSVFVRSAVLDNGVNRVAILSADLLIIHPEVTQALSSRLKEIGWNLNDVFLSATHSHSSIGGWGPGLAGKMISGEFDENIRDFIVARMIDSIGKAEANMSASLMNSINVLFGDYVKNRLIRESEVEDDEMRNVFFENEQGRAVLSTYAAHATCFGSKSRALTGDFPSYFHSRLDQDSTVQFSMFIAGAVASMGPDAVDVKGEEKARVIGEALGKQAATLSRLTSTKNEPLDLQSFRLKVPLRFPQLKVSRNLCVRPWLFRSALGDYAAEVSVLKIGETLMIGMPCDFSGELAIPLYAYAEERGLNLIITSFNGGYIGYVTKDEWYDLEKYETRSMNWYGPDSGAYFSEIVERIVDTLE